MQLLPEVGAGFSRPNNLSCAMGHPFIYRWRHREVGTGPRACPRTAAAGK